MEDLLNAANVVVCSGASIQSKTNSLSLSYLGKLYLLLSQQLP